MVTTKEIIKIELNKSYKKYENLDFDSYTLSGQNREPDFLKGYMLGLKFALRNFKDYKQ